jgi:hypothetical protein
MYIRLLRRAIAVASCLLSTHVVAQSALVHIQGEVGSREAYYANFAIVSDRTPVDKLFGPIAVRRLDTVIVYESPDKPEFTELRLEFECTVKYAYDGKTVPPQPAFDAPVKVRVGDGGWKLRREDLQREDVPVGAWRTANSPVLLKLHKIACNEDVMRAALVKASKHNNDMSIFRAEIKKIGLPEDLQLVSQELAVGYMDFSWYVLWHDVKRPDPTGKWSRRSTKAELEEAEKKMAQLRRQFDQLAAGIKPKLEQNIKQADEQFAFYKVAADVRGDRKLSRNESLMLSVWEAKPEREVAITMGAPVVSDVGGLRFLSYGQEFDNRVIVGNRQGAVWEEGLYENCSVQFVLHRDDKNTFRVADVRIWTDSNRIGQVVFACNGLLETPR